MSCAFVRWLLPLLALAALTACLRQPEATEPDASHFSAGDLRLGAHKDVPRTVYIDMRDAMGRTPISTAELASALRRDNFRIVESPSEAGYILHINLLQEGPVDSSTLKALVDAGYGSDAQFSGTGQSAWLADALLVQRRVPSDKRASQTRLKNISSRNALDNAQMRIGIQIARELHSRQAFESAFGQQLAQIIRSGMAN